MLLALVSILLLAFVSAVGFRIRGGYSVAGTAISHTLGRLAWAGPVTVGATLITDRVQALALLPFMFAACTVPTFKAIDMGRMEGTVWRDAAWNLLRGLIFSAAAALPLWALGIVGTERAIAILGIGVFMPVMYELGWRTPSTIKGLEQGSAIAEAYWGGFYGLALAAALVKL